MNEEPGFPPSLVLWSGNTEGSEGLRVRFHWHGDRYAHSIIRVRPRETREEMFSIESASDALWPSSPPLQQISVEPIGSGIAALAVGAAGRAYWSTSIVPVMFEGHSALQFDIAMRTQETPQVWGTEYRWTRGDQRIVPLPHLAPTEVQLSGDRLRVFPASQSGPSYRWAYLIL